MTPDGRRAFRELLRRARPPVHWLGAIVVLSLLGTAVAVLRPWPLKLLVDCALGTEPLPDPVRRALGWLGGGTAHPMEAGGVLVLAAALGLALYLINAAVDFAVSWCWVTAGEGMVYALGNSLFARYLKLRPPFLARHGTGDALSRLGTDTYAAYGAVEGLLLTPAEQLLTLAAVGYVAFRLEPELALLTLLVAPFLAVSARGFGPRIREGAAAQREAESRLLGFVHETLSALPLVQGFGTEGRNLRRFGELAEEARSRSERQTLNRGAFQLLNGLVLASGHGLVLFVASRRVAAGTLGVGSLLVFLSYLTRMQWALEQLLGLVARLRGVEASLDRLREVFESPELAPEPRAPRAPAPRRGRAGAALRFEAVSAGFEAGRPVLRDVCLEVEPATTLAIVGPTGAGKSTLLALVPRLLDPWSGRVLLDGLDVRDLDLAALRRELSLLLQEPYLLPLSVADNIAYGTAGATPEGIREAARAARAHEFIEGLPEGYATRLGERGLTLSGGERQRIAIARALLRDAPVLLLDEPGAALDAATESEVLAALETLCRGRTTLLVSHRLRAVQGAHRIAVLEAGRITEAGGHGELLARDGSYARLWRLQCGAGPAVAPGGPEGRP